MKVEYSKRALSEEGAISGPEKEPFRLVASMGRVRSPMSVGRPPLLHRACHGLPIVVVVLGFRRIANKVDLLKRRPIISPIRPIVSTETLPQGVNDASVGYQLAIVDQPNDHLLRRLTLPIQ